MGQQWKRLTYTFDVLDERTEEKRGTLEVHANGYMEADGEVDAWLDKNPGYVIGNYSYVPHPPPAQQQWKTNDSLDMRHLERQPLGTLARLLGELDRMAASGDPSYHEAQRSFGRMGLTLGYEDGQRLTLHVISQETWR